jgi:hypothetical protein
MKLLIRQLVEVKAYADLSAEKKRRMHIRRRLTGLIEY